MVCVRLCTVISSHAYDMHSFLPVGMEAVFARFATMLSLLEGSTLQQSTITFEL